MQPAGLESKAMIQKRRRGPLEIVDHDDDMVERWSRPGARAWRQLAGTGVKRCRCCHECSQQARHCYMPCSCPTGRRSASMTLIFCQILFVRLEDSTSISLTPLRTTGSLTAWRWTAAILLLSDSSSVQ